MQVLTDTVEDNDCCVDRVTYNSKHACVKYYVLHTEDNRTDYLTIQYDGITDTFKTWVFKSSIKTIAEDDLAYYLFSEFGDMTPTESASSVIDFAYDAGKAT